MTTEGNLIIGILLLFLLLINGVEMCVREEDGCVGGRPPSPNGCCPMGAGEECGGEEGVQCDEDLGYRCMDEAGSVTTQRGICTGRYNLTVSDTGPNTVTLEWEDFKPDDYYFEYVLLFRKDSFSADTAAWELWDIGTRAQYTVTKLEAGTLYCMRLALWVDARATVLGNFSEAIWVNTDAVTHCTHNGRVFDLGEVVDNCEDRCTCTATGQMKCTPSCPQSSLPEVPEGCSLMFLEECSCNATVSCPREEEEAEREAGCNHNGTNYRVGASFTSECALCVCSQGNHVNCTPTACPAPEWQLARLLCPNPQVRRDGCCDTLFCMDENPDPQAFVSRLMALSFAPNTLTISFDVDHVTSSHTVTQDRYEVITSDGQGSAASWSSSTYTPTTLTSDDNVSSPSDLLHADAAIRVDNRVFITLDGLRPNTTYFVHVEPVVKRDMGVTETAFNSTLIGFFVARTMGKDPTCLVEDIVYHSGDVISEDCEQVCACDSGEVVCRPACPEERMVLLSSSACPSPQLVPSERPCCKTWRCLPEGGGCAYKDTFLKNEEVFLDGECGHKCKCTQGEITCTSVCPPVKPAPRPKCILTNVTNSCCPVWMCPQVTKPPLGLAIASQIGFHGECTNDDTLKVTLSRALENRIQGHMSCADRESPFFVSCWVKDVVVTCPRQDLHRKRREIKQIELVAVIAANITDANNEAKILTSLNETERVLASLFTAYPPISLPLDNGGNVTSSGTFHSFGISRLCPDGFAYQQSVCVPESVSPRQFQNTTLTLFAIASHSATLVWPPLSQPWRPYVTAFVIEFRVTSSSTWNRTMTLNPMTTNMTLVKLAPSQSYEARLVALTTFTSPDRVTMSTVQFTTPAFEALTSAFTFDTLQVTLGDTSATFKWPPLPTDVTEVISTFKVTYRQSGDGGKEKVIDLDPNLAQMTLTGLESGTAYHSKFVIGLSNGTTITMTSLHFVTKTAGTSDVPVIPLLATCAVLVLLSILIPVIFLIWRRFHKKSAQETAFENKTYGVNITSLCTTRAKNECARPQDPDSGSAAAPSSRVSESPDQA